MDKGVVFLGKYLRQYESQKTALTVRDKILEGWQEHFSG